MEGKGDGSVGGKGIIFLNPFLPVEGALTTRG